MGNTKSGMIERKALISSVQKYNMHDGPGIRTIVFFKGCPLRCKWCSNPEGLERKQQVMYRRTSCIDCGACIPVCPVGIHSISPATHQHVVNWNIDCIGCRRCQDACPQGALTIVGDGKTISELMEIIEEDRMFYDMSGGGLTIGGGEVLMQPEAATNLLMVCKKEGINTAIETSGYAKLESLLQVAEFVDLFLFDLKHMNPEKHFENTGVRNEIILQNLKELFNRRYNIRIRMPLLKGINDDQEEIDEVIKFLSPYKDCKNFKGVDLLPYHKLGVNKYNQLGLDYPVYGDPTLRGEDLERIESSFNKAGIQATLVKH